ncbi:hypothetical protein BM536_037215 [Streptomyces phaeoluteigriseus]|uniref:Pyrrolo-quinoline quinone repeat domain-containing protein n=1 Tax=Streptomyces phaeoluteigriseus TaxID=114686 RepID=A0A1V6MI09_9ACTN|nr:hypothetical protein BM536_037215 [Streptomyces phaeoluteigriseus]
MSTDLGRTGHTNATGPLAEPRERWVHPLPSRHPTQPLPAGELLLAVSWTGALQAIDRTTGSLAWENPTPRLLTAAEEPLDIPAALAADGNRAFVNVEDTLRAVDCATGRTLWDKTWPLADASGPPTAGGGALLVTGWRRLSRIDPMNGSTLWVCDLPEPGPVATAATIAGNLAWIAEAASPYHPGGLRVIDLTTGKARARTSAETYLYPFHPATAGGLAWTLIFDEAEQTVVLAAFDDAGHITRTLRPSCADVGQELIAPAIAHQTLLVTDTSHIHALDLTNGRTHWSAPIAAPPQGRRWSPKTPSTRPPRTAPSSATTSPQATRCGLTGPARPSPHRPWRTSTTDTLTPKSPHHSPSSRARSTSGPTKPSMPSIRD